MTQSNTGDADVIEAKLPRRDWILLPAISLLTIFILVASTLSAASWLFPTSATGMEGCYVKNDPFGNARAIPNSVCSERTVEGKVLVEYKFNACGHRAGVACGPKTPGTYRIVMIGSSMAMGLFVPREKTFAALLPIELSKETGRKIEIYNEASGGKFRGGPFPVQTSDRDFHEVLSVDPDMILWIVTPADIENMSFADSVPVVPIAPIADEPTTALEKLKVAVTDGSIGDKFRRRWDKTTASLVMKHFLYGNESQDQYVKSYLTNENDAGFLKTNPSAKWQHLLNTFQVYAASFEAQSKAAGVPFVAVMIPNRAQAAMISAGEWPAGYDPYKLDNEVRAIIVDHGGTYVDILPDFRKVAGPEQYYFPVDGHPDADGHKILSDFMAKELTNGAVPTLRAAVQPHESEQGR
jgi:hypothetical protein